MAKGKPTILVGVAEATPFLDPATRAIDRAQALRILNSAGPMLYAIRTPDGLIKIGRSIDVARRRRKVGTEILAVAFGDWADEKAIHDGLDDYHRAHGREYYYPTLEVLAVVNEMRERLGLDPVDT